MPWAIAPRGIGKLPGVRAVATGWPLEQAEAFFVDADPAGRVLAEDGASLRAPTAEDFPPRYFLAEDFVRLVGQLPNAAQDAIMRARQSTRRVDGMWSLLLSKGQLRVDMQGATFAQAWALLSSIIEPVVGADGVSALRSALDAVSTR